MNDDYKRLVKSGAVLACCTTPFQIMMVVLLKMTVYKNNKMDLLITEHPKGYERLVDGAMRSEIFRNVGVYKDGEIEGIYNKDKYNTRFNRLIRNFHRDDFVRDCIKAKDYQTFLVSDALISLNYLYDYLIRKVNKKIDLVYFEEGPISTMSDQCDKFHEKNYYRGNLIRRLILPCKRIEGNFTYGFTSVKDSLEWKPYFPLLDIPLLNSEMSEYVEKLNIIWNYERESLYRQKYIFFEESFYQDGISNKDLEAINDIGKMVGKENVIVKLHPRTQVNRFEKIGFATNSNNVVPWELIALNHRDQIKEKVLISFTSGASVHPQLYWGIEQNGIALGGCKEYHFDILDKAYYQVYLDVSRKRKLQFVPSTYAELKNYLTQL